MSCTVKIGLLALYVATYITYVSCRYPYGDSYTAGDIVPYGNARSSYAADRNLYNPRRSQYDRTTQDGYYGRDDVRDNARRRRPQSILDPINRVYDKLLPPVRDDIYARGDAGGYGGGYASVNRRGRRRYLPPRGITDWRKKYRNRYGDDGYENGGLVGSRGGYDRGYGGSRYDRQPGLYSLGDDDYE